MRFQSNPTALIAILCLLIFAPGCIVHKLKVNKPEGDFAGMEPALADADKLSVFITHGMGIQDLVFADQLINSTTGALQFNPVDTTYYRQNKGVLKVITFRKGAKQLKFYIHGWYLATQAKWSLVWTDRNEDRLETMDDIKYTLMNQSVSDVIMYQGNFRKRIKTDMEATLKRMVEDEPEAKIIGISESLGSKIFIETMNDNLNSGSDWAKLWQKNLTTIFMLSNQLPLLYLGDLDDKAAWVRTATADRSSYSTAQLEQANKEIYKPLTTYTKYGDRSNSKIELVAISDANDLLCYPIPKYAVYAQNYKLTNVTISIAKKGYSWPFGKPKIVNPIDAHLNYQKNEYVINYLIHGNASGS